MFTKNRKIIKKISLLSFVYLALSGCSSLEKVKDLEVKEIVPKLKCTTQRGALDIGSGSTKFTLAQVDLCKNKILSIIETAHFPFKFKEHLSYNDGLLKENIFNTSSSKLNKYFNSLQIEKGNIRAVATEVFREAHNGKEFIKRLSQNIGIKIHLISQQEEALLGFKGAQVTTGHKAAEILVWDIGGGSMQMTSYSSGSYDFYKGKLASVSLKNEVLKWKNKDRGSPNPLGEYLGKKALFYSIDYAREHTPQKIREAIKKGKRVIGIGGVHYYSIKNQLKLLNNTPYSLFQVEQELNKRVHFRDQNFKGDYKETEATNLALIAGHMKALNIRTVLPVKVNLATGLLFTERLW